MKIGKNLIVSEASYDKEMAHQYEKGFKSGERTAKNRVESLETALERKTKAHTKLEKTIEELNEEIKVYQGERESVHKVVQQRLENEDIAAGLDVRQESLDRKTAKLKDREAELDQEEDRHYKSGYADGAADTARKISEITEKDRDNMAKVAMVSAASHTSPQIVREVMNGANQLTAGTSNQEG